MVHQPPGNLTPGVEKAEAQRGQVALPRVTSKLVSETGLEASPPGTRQELLPGPTMLSL